MVEALLFHRTPTTKISDTADPYALPTAQKLEFTLPGNVWEAIEETFQLNHKKIPIPTPLGASKKIRFTPVGMLPYSRKISGFFKDAPTGLDRIYTFRKLTMVDTHHEFGIFGLKVPQFPKLDSDPTNTFGWSFDGYQLKNFSRLINKIVDFTIDIGFGGTLP